MLNCANEKNRFQNPVRPSLPAADVVIVGGGVAGAAAALAARRSGCDVLLLEKATLLGGLATLGIINFFVPMDNGAGRQVVKGIAEEFLRLAVLHGFDTLPEPWRHGEPAEPTSVHYTTSFSPQIFALELLGLLVREGVRVRFDSLATGVDVDGGRIVALEVEDKSGRTRVDGRVFIDASGDADLCWRVGAPCETGINYFSYFGRAVTLQSCADAVKAGDIAKVYAGCSGGAAGLDGSGHPAGMKTYEGGNPEDISEFLVANQLELLRKIEGEDRRSREIVTLPTIPQMRTTRHLVGNHVLTTDDIGRRQPDSIGVVPDFCDTSNLYEVPYRVLTRRGFPNLLAVGRCASASGFAWDVLRVIPPAILTGEAAGLATSLAMGDDVDVGSIDIAKLQAALAGNGIYIHIPPFLRRKSKAGRPAPGTFAGQLSSE